MGIVFEIIGALCVALLVFIARCKQRRRAFARGALARQIYHEFGCEFPRSQDDAEIFLQGIKLLSFELGDRQFLRELIGTPCMFPCDIYAILDALLNEAITESEAREALQSAEGSYRCRFEDMGLVAKA